MLSFVTRFTATLTATIKKLPVVKKIVSSFDVALSKLLAKLVDEKDVDKYKKPATIIALVAFVLTNENIFNVVIRVILYCGLFAINAAAITMVLLAGKKILQIGKSTLAEMKEEKKEE